jgi:hypothetical protein
MAPAPDRLWSRDVEKAVAGKGKGEGEGEGDGEKVVGFLRRKGVSRTRRWIGCACAGHVVKPRAGGFYPNKE